MAEMRSIAMNAALGRRGLAAILADDPGIATLATGAPRLEEFRPARPLPDRRIPSQEPAPAPASQPATATAATPTPVSPTAPASDPFAELPFPNPGDRIKAEDFRRLAQGLRVVADAHALAGAMFGLPFGTAEAALRAQGYEVARVVSAGGTELSAPGDPMLNDRRVLAVAPVALGQPRLNVVVTDTAATADRRMPSLLGLTYRAAATRLQTEAGDLLAGAGPMTAPQLVGRTLSDAEQGLAG